MIRKLRNSRGFTLVELMIVVAIVGILAALAIFGVKKYVSNAKSAEARNTVGQISKNAAGAWAREIMPGSILEDATSIAGANKLCTSAAPVPAGVPKGEKYQSSTDSTADYNVGSNSAGWVCLRFAMEGPQYYQYNYTSSQADANTGTFDSVAIGDLNGDTKTSSFTRSGVVRNGQIVLSPAIVEVNPDE
ncbi:MAG TPA: prepilin-type N-terminal cleavage/methylation domain-containing protein [Polyangiaceae bacterium]